ncbi:MAG: mechanosensitive ion channel domain-containing protein, partial [Bacteroidota bacterium]
MFQDFLQQTFFQNRILDYLVSAGLFLLGVLIVTVFKRIVLRRLKSWAEKTATTLDDFLIHITGKSLVPLLYFGVFFLSTLSLTLNPTLEEAIEVIGVVLLTIVGILFFITIVEYTIRDLWLKKKYDVKREKSFRGVLPAIKVIIWALGLIFLLDNLGFKISAVIAGLGIGGIAVALAAQAILGDLFSYFAIMIDRPFEVGDFIIDGEYLGTIEHIGIKTTRIRSLGGEQLVLSNTDLTNSRVRNYKRMAKRRVVFRLGVTYQTTHQQLQEIPAIIRHIIEDIKDTDYDRAHFASYGDFSL